MTKISKVLFWILCICVLVSVAATFYRTIVLHDFETFYDDYGEEAPSEENVL